MTALDVLHDPFVVFLVTFVTTSLVIALLTWVNGRQR
jgi:hypothetical protein